MSTRSTPLTNARAAIRPALAWVFLFSLAANLLVFVPSIYSLQVYDRVMTSRNMTTLAMLSVIALGLLLAYALITHLRSKILVAAGGVFHQHISGPAFEAALSRALASRSSNHAQIVRDADTLRDTLSGPAPVTLFDLPWAPIFIFVCFLFHPLIGATALAGALVLLAIGVLNDIRTRRPLLDASLLAITAQDRLSGHLRNAAAIRGLGMAEGVRARWNIDHDAAHARATTANDRAATLQSLGGFVRLALQVAMLGVGAMLVVAQEISPGVMFASSLIMGRAITPLEQAVGHWRALVSARGAYARLAKIFADEPERNERMSLPRPDGHVTVERLFVVPPGGSAAVVKDVSFKLAPGDTLAIVGPTGSGKSTLVKTMVGAIAPKAGAVRFDGFDINQFAPRDFGRAVGFLPQEVELFAGTVADNVSRFSTERSDEAVIEAAKTARAHALIQSLPVGYDTPVGEDGVGLSGGQRQRVGLARALYGSPSIIVLDEPNANLDGAGDADLVNALRDLSARGATTIIVSHKPNILQAASHILVMADGAARIFGKREEVLPLILPGNTPRPTMVATPTAA